MDSGPATFELTVHNRGNVHRSFQEESRLLATSGGAEIPFENFTVLGGSTRVVEAVWADPPLLCWCTVEVEVDDGQGGVVTASTRVIAFPLRLTLALLAITGGLALVVAGRRRRRHRQAPAAAVPTPSQAPPPEPAPAEREAQHTAHSSGPTRTRPMQDEPSQLSSTGMFTAKGTAPRRSRRSRG